jgi:hypothetical protein
MECIDRVSIRDGSGRRTFLPRVYCGAASEVELACVAVIDQHGEMARERLGRAITKAWQCDPADHPKMLDDPNEPMRRN